jgi:hydroxyacylglutathione hydrolase
MVFETFKVDGLGCRSYLVGDSGQAAVVDPQRDVDVYVEAANRLGVRITAVIETHLHADHVSGGRELADATGAPLFIHEAARAEVKHQALRDGEVVKAGRAELRVLHTPGHTPESVCLVVTAPDSTAPRLLSGDTLFVGDVGRPDLTGDEAARGLASMLYRSLFERVLALADDVIVHPGHGEGSLCGTRGIGGGETTTIGQERRMNHALRPASEPEFVERIIAGLPDPPADFHRIKRTNRSGTAPLRGSLRPRALSPAEVRALIAGDAQVLDARPGPQRFGEAHLPASIWIAPDGPFATRAAWFTRRGFPIVLVVDSAEAAHEAARALCRVGVDEVAGWLEGGIEAWRSAGFPVASLPQMTPEAIERERPRVLDVRERHEWQEGHVEGALHEPLGRLAERLDLLERREPIAVMCASGNRSTTAASFLCSKGFTNVRNAAGGVAAW